MTSQKLYLSSICSFYTCDLPLHITINVFCPFFSWFVDIFAQNWKHLFIDILKEKAKSQLFLPSLELLVMFEAKKFTWRVQS